MPLYEYLCEANGQVVEVVHRMSERFSTWGEVCAHMGREVGDTAADAPVRKLVGGGSQTNAPGTLKKQLAADGKASTTLKHGATVSPMRKKSF